MEKATAQTTGVEDVSVANLAALAVDVHTLTESILASLDARSRDIVVRRFGLEGKAPETLESIGKEYGITRERVRQIEANAKKVLLKVRQQLQQVEELFNELFRQHGGLMAPRHFTSVALDRVTQGGAPHMVNFYLELLPEYAYVAKSKTFHPHWKHDSSLSPHVEDIVMQAMEILDAAKKPLPLAQIAAQLHSKLGMPEDIIPVAHIKAALMASKFVDETVFGQWGLSAWPETSPRGVADKAYAVLRNFGKPAHFREITTLINESGFDTKKANPQTVHNELIKDSRFVLVGRGLYALTEWGYMTGTVGDVLATIMQKVDGPLTKEELIEKVLEQRIVKKNTILLSLQNAKRFLRDSEGKYSLKSNE